MVKKTDKKGGGKLNRTQTVTIRLDPKLRYLTDLAARAQRRTTSGFIEWAIANSLKDVGVYSQIDNEPSFADRAYDLWEVDEAHRFIKLATEYAALLTHDEQILWKSVKRLTNLNNLGGVLISDFEWDLMEKISENWDDLKAAAAGDDDKIKKLKKVWPN